MQPVGLTHCGQQRPWGWAGEPLAASVLGTARLSTSLSSLSLTQFLFLCLSPFSCFPPTTNTHGPKLQNGRNDASSLLPLSAAQEALKCESSEIALKMFLSQTNTNTHTHWCTLTHMHTHSYTPPMSTRGSSCCHAFSSLLSLCFSSLLLHTQG